MYVDGKMTAKDPGGVGVKFEAPTQSDNFYIGRNIGGKGAFFASFYISSFVVFRQFLEAPAVYSVNKYYSSHGKAWDL